MTTPTTERQVDLIDNVTKERFRLLTIGTQVAEECLCGIYSGSVECNSVYLEKQR